MTGKNTSGPGSTQQIGPPAYSCTTKSYPGPERTFKVIDGNAGQVVIAEVYGLDGDVALLAVDADAGGQCNATTSCLSVGDAFSSAGAEALGFTPEPAKDYYLLVDGTNAAAFSLTVQCIPAGGCMPTKAIQLGQTIATSNVLGTGTNVTNNIGHHAPFSGSGWTGPEAAYVFTPTTTANYTVTAKGPAGAELLGCDLDLFIKASAAGCGSETLAYSSTVGKKAESAAFSGVANTTYFIVVDGFTDSGVGCATDFELSVSN